MYSFEKNPRICPYSLAYVAKHYSQLLQSISSHFDVCNKCLPKYRSFKYNYLSGNLHTQYGILFISGFFSSMYKQIKPTKEKVSEFWVTSQPLFLAK